MKKTSLISTILLVLLIPTFALAEATPSATTTSAATVSATDPAPTAPTFSDLSQTHKNYVAIKYLAGQGILKGYADGTFKPDQLVNRAEALKIILAGSGIQTPETTTTSTFKDVKTSDWFAPYIVKGKELYIVNGNPDGTYAPEREVAESEFIKMTLMANDFKSETWVGKQLFTDVPADAWFAPYLNYAGTAGILAKDAKNNLYPSHQLSRGEVAQILYLVTIIRKGTDTQFLLDQAQAQINQSEFYVQSNQLLFAKGATELSVDTTQQALHNMPDNTVVLSGAKIARAYDYLINAYISAVSQNNTDAKSWADQAIAKSTEAWETNHDIQPVAAHVKELANALLTQLPTK